MHNDATTSARVSAPTSPSAPQPHDKLSEAEHIERQAQDARLAIRETLVEMRETLKAAGDVTAWTRQYPWTTVGVATAVGFLAAKAVIPGRHKDVEPPRLLERVLADEKIAQRVRELASSDDSGVQSTMLGSILTLLVKTLASSLPSAVSAVVKAHATDSSTNTNGHASADAAAPGDMTS